ncbi:hypothetical protein Mgra_00006805 [Meloidogyne graminicola]|uniref:Uncharacterized protein n=1 Tax=Meloidogyne graminicola TaxID=189291 RepID=A0A8S9ZKC1_9BILA|nr:hypothetical protein Mgra_00006805 [Meloidogyne graminicola]
MKSIIVNNNFWKKKTMFINILAIFAVLLLVLIEQMKTEGVAIKIVEKEDQLISGKKLFLTRFSMAQTNETSKPKLKNGKFKRIKCQWTTTMKGKKLKICVVVVLDLQQRLLMNKFGGRLFS